MIGFGSSYQGAAQRHRHVEFLPVAPRSASRQFSRLDALARLGREPQGIVDRFIIDRLEQVAGFQAGLRGGRVLLNRRDRPLPSLSPGDGSSPAAP